MERPLVSHRALAALGPDQWKDTKSEAEGVCMRGAKRSRLAS